METFYYPEGAFTDVVSSIAFKLKLTEAVPTDFEAQDVAGTFYFTVKSADGTEFDFIPIAASLSGDRLITNLNMGNDLAGEKGQIIGEDFQKELVIPFNFSTQAEVPIEDPVETPEPVEVPADYENISSKKEDRSDLPFL